MPSSRTPSKSPKNEVNGTDCRYPLPSYLKFTPGGIISPSGVEDAKLHKHNLSQIFDPSILFQRALDADIELHKHSEVSSLQANNGSLSNSDVPFRAPSLSVLAEAAFGALTGVQPSRARAWADAMVLYYYYNSHSSNNKSNPSLKRRQEKDVSSLLSHLKETAQLNNNKSSLKSKKLNRPCGYIFRRGDIAWNCRTCQTDSTCVLCDACFRNSDHEGHDVFFHRTSPGGCCDCGDAEAWKVEGCCPNHRPAASFDEKPEQTMNGLPNNYNGNLESAFDDFEAVTASLKGRKDGESILSDDELLTPPLKAALGVVIGAVIQCAVKAVDGAGIGADAIQWRIYWAQQLYRISTGCAHEEDECGTFSSMPSEHTTGSQDSSRELFAIRKFLNTSMDFPPGYELHLRLHNDDVHTFDQVIKALHDQDGSNNEDDEMDQEIFEALFGIDDDATLKHANSSTESAPTPRERYRLVPQREEAEKMTHHVDSDGQVKVKSFKSFKNVMNGFKRLKNADLHCAIISSPQDDMERRVKMLVGWLKDIASAHPAVAALVAHALCDVTNGQDTFGGVSVWTEPRMIPCWSGLNLKFEIERLKAFPPHLSTSYLTREEGRVLHKHMKAHKNAADLFHITGSNPHFYNNAMLNDYPSERLKKSPHALWGTISLPQPSDKLLHPLLANAHENIISNSLCPNIYFVDTDTRKQQETGKLTSSLLPHKLSGLHMISGIGLFDAKGGGLNDHDLLKLLDVASYRAPFSPLLLILLLDPYPPKQMRAAIHQLFLSLLVDSRFRSRFAAAFGGVAYRPLSTLFCAGCGTEADTPLGFTVQVFTTGSLVRALGNSNATQKLLEYDGSDPFLTPFSPSLISTFTMPLPLTVVRAVHTNLLGATKEVKMVVNNISEKSPTNLCYQEGEHPLVTLLPAAPDDGFLDSHTTKHKRIPHLLRDLEYIFETPGTALRLLLPKLYTISKMPQTQIPVDGKVIEFVQAWARLLRLAQGMDPQRRRISGGHVEFENVRWYEAFGLSINFAGMRDSLAESPVSIANESEDELALMKKAVGNLLTAILQEIKFWLYQEQLLNTGLPELSMVNPIENQLEAPQRSTLHVSPYHLTNINNNFTNQRVAVACATGVKMTEAQLSLIEMALKNDEEVKRPVNTTPGAIMRDWLRVPHSPLMGNFFSFHLPLHRALAKTIKSFFSVPVSMKRREQYPLSWWKIPVLDANENYANHILKEVLKSTISTKNCQVTWSDGLDCTSVQAQSRRARKHSVSSAIAAAKVTHSLCDHPLRCLAASQQIDRHLWARNGNSATGMALNYGSSPLCHSFRDLDLALVQLSISGFSVGLGARRSFGLLMSRFNMDGYLCDPVKRVNSNSAVGGNNGGWVNPPRMQDPDHAVAMSEAFFSTLCMLVTELPPPPSSSKQDDSIMKMIIRRELIHALAAEPRSYSEALSAATSSLREESDTLRNAFSEVLMSVAVEKRSQAQVSRAAPPTYELKADCSDEYDPSFFHLRRIEHQHAMDRVARLRKQKCTNKGKLCLPLVTSPPLAHLRFLSSRLILHIPMTDAAIRRALLFTLTDGSWLPPSKPEIVVKNSSSSPSTLSNDMPLSFTSKIRKDVRSASAMKKKNSKPIFSRATVSASSVSFLEVLQVLTLQVHTLEECSHLHKKLCLDEESYRISVGISINSYLERLIFVPNSLEDCWALGYPDPLPSAGSGDRRGSILGILIAIYEHLVELGATLENKNNDDGGGGARALVAEGLKWLLRFVSVITEDFTSIDDAKNCATNGVRRSLNSKKRMKDEMIEMTTQEVIMGMFHNLPNLWPLRKDPTSSITSDKKKDDSKSDEAKKARERILKEMRKKQKNFAARIAASDDMEKKHSNLMDTSDDEGDLCIICKCDDTDGDNNGPLGYLGHVQRSRVLQLRGMNEVMNGDEVHCTARVVGRKGCQLRAGEEMDSAPIACLPQGSIVTVLKSKISSNYDLLSRRVFVRFDGPTKNNQQTPTEGWASVESSQGYVILAPLKELCYNNSRWGSTRPIVKQCGHAAHLGCVETHCLSLHQRSASDQPFDGRFAANVDEGEFLCPLCKQLSNILVPKGWNKAALLEEAEKQSVDEELLNLPTIDSCGVEGAYRLKRLLISGMEKSIPNEIRTGATNPVVQKMMNEMEATKRFGDNLLIAMQTPWHLKSDHIRKRHGPFLTKWDYQDESKDLNLDEVSDDNVGNILHLLRQQHIAWASVGHSAAAAEASKRSSPPSVVNDSSSLSFKDISDPWVDYDVTCRDSHPMLLELRRTLNATVSLLVMLNYEMEKKLNHEENESLVGTTIIGELLGNILGGEDNFLDEWNALLPHIASQPCHLARDGMLKVRNEIRSTAASMWAVKGTATNIRGTQVQSLPPTPLAVNMRTKEVKMELDEKWGTNDPYKPSKSKKMNRSSCVPFRPAIASAFLYLPLLAWDLNTLSTAILSSLLLGKTPQCGYEDLLLTARLLLVGRLIQSLITPNGFYTYVDNTMCTSKRIKKDDQCESRSLFQLQAYCRDFIEGCKGNTMDTSKDEDDRLMTNVSHAILPFARSLILMLRACCSTIRRNKKMTSCSNSNKPSPAERTLISLLEDEEAMSIDDGFQIFRVIGGPMPSELVLDTKEGNPSSWKKLIDRWLSAVVSLEAFHGSRGKGMSYNGETGQWIPSYMQSDEKLPETIDSVVVEEENGENKVEVTSGFVDIVSTESMENDDGFFPHTDDDSEDEEMENVEDNDRIYLDVESMDSENDAFTDASNSTQTNDGLDDENSYYVDDEKSSYDSKFAYLSSAPIIPFQPSLLRKQEIGPGPRGIPFDFMSVSNIVHDMSHLGMIHCPDAPGSGLIRLPHSFVELYSMVNKVKRRDLVNVDECDDSSNSEIAICLLTGSIMRSGSTRRPLTRYSRPVGPCTLHARKVGSGIGIFFLVQKCTVLLMHNNKSAYSASLYVDDHGEEDPGLRRGRPLFLKSLRYEALETLWRQHGIPREVSQIRSTSDRVIRDNWY